MAETPWQGVLVQPLAGRSAQSPRRGLTMVIDKGLGLGQTHDLLSLAASYIDLIRL